MFTFTPLLGARSSSLASQSLLELDGGVKILVDVGWDESFDASELQELEKHASTLSIVLLTHSTIEHTGAYAHCCKHVAGFSKVPCYATTPVVNLGRTLMQDMYGSAALAASIIPQESILSSTISSSPGGTPNLLLQPPTPEEIANYFGLINSLKYSQPHQPIPSPFSPPLAGLTITAYSAGHTLGGTIWHIQHGLESIVYAADWNLGRENFFPGAAWLSSGNEVNEPLFRPTALVCSSRGVESTETLTRRKRDETLISLIRETIAQGGKVLIPTDSSARVLELAFLLNEQWRENIDGPHADTYNNAHIYMASKSSSATVRYLQSMLEWMEDSVTRNTEAAMSRGKGQGKVNNPLEWAHVKQIEKRSQIERALGRSRPCVMLASDASLDWGFSRQALQAMAADPRNLVVLTEKVGPVDKASSGLGRQLWEFYQQQQGHTSAQSGAKIVDADGFAVELQEMATEPLDADESGLYQQYLARQRQLHSTLHGDDTMNDTITADMGEDEASESSESSDEDQDTEHQGRALNLSAQLTQNKRKAGALTDAELGVNVLLRSKNMHDYDVRNKRGREKMFPFVAHRDRNDEYGDLIRPEEYLRAEERDEVDGVDLRDGPKQDTAVGQKRKWDGEGKTSGSKARKTERGQDKRARVAPEKPKQRDAIDDVIAQITGEAVGGGAGASGAAVNGVDESSSDSEESEYEPEDSASEGPQKLVFSTRTLELRMRITYVDFSGLYHLRDFQGIIPRVRPRKLILTAGNEQETRSLAEACRGLEEGAVGEIFTPLVGEAVDASVDTNAWTLKLSQALMKRLNWKELEIGGLSVASISGVLGAEPSSDDASSKAAEEESAKKKLKLVKDEPSNPASTSEEVPSMPILDLATTSSTTAVGGAPQHHLHATQPVWVGDLRLVEIRNAMLQTGHTAEFRGGGTLLVDGSVVVRKDLRSGGLELEAVGRALGVPGWRTVDGRGRLETGGTFFAVRRAIYERLAVVAGA